MANSNRQREKAAHRKPANKSSHEEPLHSTDRTPAYGQDSGGGERFGESQRLAERTHLGGHGERTTGGQIYETDQGYGPTRAGGPGYSGPKTPGTNPVTDDDGFGGIEGDRGQGAPPPHAHTSRAEGQYLGRGGYAEEQPPGLAPSGAALDRKESRGKSRAKDGPSDE